MKKTIVYIHGYGSSPNTQKVLSLRDAGYTVIAPNVPLLYDDALNTLKHLFYSLPKDDIMIVGSSLGGYWASIMSDLFIVPAVLINPSCNPKKSLPSYKNPLLTADELDKFAPLKKSNKAPKIVLIANDDKVLDPKVAFDHFNDVAHVKTFDKGGHMFMDINTISNNINELSNHSFYLP